MKKGLNSTEINFWKVVNLFFSTAIILVIVITVSCRDGENPMYNQMQEVQFSFNYSETNSGRISAFSDPASIVITISDENGNNIFLKEEVDLHLFNNNYLSVPITLKIGTYSLEEFYVLDEDNKVIYISPKESSDKAHLVEHPLPISLEISQDSLATITPEVLPVDEEDLPQEFGYAQFGFDLVNLVEFIVSVFIQHEEGFQLTEANMHVVGTDLDENLWTSSFKLEPSLNTVELREEEFYIITISKEGYIDWKDTLKVTENDFTLEVLLNKESDAITFEKAIGGSDFDFGYAIIEKQAGGFIAVGSSRSSDGDLSSNNGGNDFFVVSLNESGRVDWQRSFGGSDNDSAFGVIEANDNGYVVVGGTRSDDIDVSENKGSWDYWIVKIDNTGNLVWQKTFGGSSFDIAHDISKAGSNGYFISGVSSSNDGDVSNNKGDLDAWVIHIDNNGSLIWERSIGGSSRDSGRSISTTKDGGCTVVGDSWSHDGDVFGNNGQYDILVFNLTSTGELSWSKLFGGSSDEAGHDIYIASNGDYILSGSSKSSDGHLTHNYGLYDFWILRIDDSGGLLWSKSFGGNQFDDSFGIVEATDGNVWASGFSSSVDGEVSQNNGSVDYWLIKMDGTTGTLLSESSFGGSGGDSASDLIRTSDDGFVIFGSTQSNDGDIQSGNNGQSDMWVVKLDAHGN